ncbi:uncharacterized protein LOC135397688 [Ornithodoros turicata]|uniref:uncharacterized protein LOC135397688 n=1 Tax=Ornithodoros turicata TaxID=34597 RepID=UPI00313892F9
MPLGWVLMLTVVNLHVFCGKADGPRDVQDDEDSSIAAELGQVLRSNRDVRKAPGREEWPHEYPTLTKNGILLQGEAYAIDDTSLAWRLIRNYATTQLFAVKISGSNDAMRTSLLRHNAKRFDEFLDQVEKAEPPRSFPSRHNVHVFQASGIVSEVNVYVIICITTVLVALLSGYFAYVVVRHTGLLGTNAGKSLHNDKEAQCLLSRSADCGEQSP